MFNRKKSFLGRFLFVLPLLIVACLLPQACLAHWCGSNSASFAFVSPSFAVPAAGFLGPSVVPYTPSYLPAGVTFNAFSPYGYSYPFSAASYPPPVVFENVVFRNRFHDRVVVDGVGNRVIVDPRFGNRVDVNVGAGANVRVRRGLFGTEVIRVGR